MRILKVSTANSGKSPVRAGVAVAALFVIMLLPTNPSPAAAQGDCTWSSAPNSNLQSITCGEALKLEREPGTEVTIFERNGDAVPKAIELKNGAILIDVLPGSQPTQIRTPHAIAAVRGTTYVVDAGADSTAVFVIKGSVSVSKLGNKSAVTLGPGQGVDVDASASLEVMNWKPKRASALLARFGR